MYKTFLLCLGLGVCLSCSVAQDSKTTAELTERTETEEQTMGTFIHTVLFWLNDDVDESGKQQLIEDCRSLLTPISSVKFLAVGPPAGTPREVVDNSYDVGLVVHFEDKAGHDLYADAETHLQFIERNQDKWKRVQVYDMIAE